MVSIVASSDLISSINDNALPKFSDYRSRVMLGDLPSDFLRIQLIESQLENSHNPDFLGYFTLTIAEAKLIKNSGPLGLLRMDPYVRFQIGPISTETPAASGGGKNPQWKLSYRINLLKGMDQIHMEIFDQRSFTEDSFIGECDIDIPGEVLEGQTYQHWYPLMGREANENENQGDILLIMSFTAMDDENRSFSNSPTLSSSSSRSNSVPESTPLYSTEDVQAIQEMFPTVDPQIIINLFDRYGGSKDLVVNQLLQNSMS